VRRLGGVAAAALGVLAVALALLVQRSRLQARAGGAENAPATLAIADVRQVGGDSAAAWLPEGLVRLVAARLSSSELQVADMADVERVRAARDGDADTATEGSARMDDLLAVGRRLDVRWVARGTVMRGDSTLLLELEVLDVASGARVRHIAAGGVDLLALADAAAAQLLDLARAGDDGPRLAELETANVAAYRHYVRAQEAANAGRQVEQLRELDAAIALDSTFGRALIDRIVIARWHGDTPLAGRLERLLLHGDGRLTARDRLEAAAIDAFESGNRVLAARTGESLVHHYPWDPGSYGTLARIYLNQGRFADVERTLLRLLALDSLGTPSDLAP
jgi:TolB-like protein